MYFLERQKLYFLFVIEALIPYREILKSPDGENIVLPRHLWKDRLDDSLAELSWSPHRFSSSTNQYERPRQLDRTEHKATHASHRPYHWFATYCWQTCTHSHQQERCRHGQNSIVEDPFQETTRQELGTSVCKKKNQATIVVLLNCICWCLFDLNKLSVCRNLCSNKPFFSRAVYTTIVARQVQAEIITRFLDQRLLGTKHIV